MVFLRLNGVHDIERLGLGASGDVVSASLRPSFSSRWLRDKSLLPVTVGDVVRSPFWIYFPRGCTWTDNDAAAMEFFVKLLRNERIRELVTLVLPMDSELTNFCQWVSPADLRWVQYFRRLSRPTLGTRQLRLRLPLLPQS